MRKMNQLAALLLALLLLVALLAGCGSKKCVWCGKSFSGSGHDTGSGYVCDDCYASLSGGSPASSGSNTGIWIAVTVMVFIAVFSATSGVVYLVLQKLLPPEQPSNRSRRAQDYDYDDYEAPRPTPARPAASPQARPAKGTPRSTGNNGIWICPRDKSRNSGPYCTVCGTNRPAAPRPAAQRPQNGGNTSARFQQTEERAAYQPNAYAPRPQQPAPRPQQPVPEGARRQPAAPAYGEPIAKPRQTAAEPAEKEYRGKFARREQEEEPEIDSELLAAIFREAAEEPKE